MQTQTLTDIELTLVLVEGKLSIETFRDFFASQGPRPTKDVMYLYRNITSTFSFDEVRTFAEDAKEASDQSGQRTCYVVDSNVAFGVTRAFVSLAMEEGSTSRHVCRELAEGAKWMDVDLDRITAAFNEMIRAQDEG